MAALIFCCQLRRVLLLSESRSCVRTKVDPKGACAHLDLLGVAHWLHCMALQQHAACDDRAPGETTPSFSALTKAQWPRAMCPL
jgi:hypothetical protein